MYLYKNGDRCPCCGQVIEGRNEDWLMDFSRKVQALLSYLPPPWDQPEPPEQLFARAGVGDADA